MFTGVEFFFEFDPTRIIKMVATYVTLFTYFYFPNEVEKRVCS